MKGESCLFYCKGKSWMSRREDWLPVKTRSFLIFPAAMGTSANGGSRAGEQVQAQKKLDANVESLIPTPSYNSGDLGPILEKKKQMLLGGMHAYVCVCAKLLLVQSQSGKTHPLHQSHFTSQRFLYTIFAKQNWGKWNEKSFEVYLCFFSFSHFSSKNTT